MKNRTNLREDNQILWLGDSSCADSSLVGGKAALLSRVFDSSRVPPGFAVTAQALETLPAGATTLPAALLDRVAQAYNVLGERCGVMNPAVAIRSSALEEDSAEASFAGQLQSCLNVSGLDEVARAILRCWASARSEQALEYRRRRDLPLEQGLTAVLVQQMIQADVSAVVFSVDPVSSSDTEIIISANWGLGESIVSGAVTPDTYLARKQDLALVSQRIAEKRVMSVMVSGGTQIAVVPRSLRRQPALSHAEARDIAALALTLERMLGWPVDLECALRGGVLYLLQCRPVTGVPPPAARPAPSSISVPPGFAVRWNSPEDERLFWFMDRIHAADPLPPLAFDYLAHCYEDGIYFAVEKFHCPIRSSIRHINTYLYWSVTPTLTALDELDAENHRSRQLLDAHLASLSQIWQTEYLPEIQRFLNEWSAFDLRGATMPQLLQHLDLTTARSRRIWEIHFMIVVPLLVALDMFDELAEDLFGREQALDAFRLLRGFDNKSLEADRALWQLGRQALASDEVRRAVLECDPTRLELCSEGRAFRSALDSWLERYGRRSSKISVADPSWIEDPSPVWRNLQHYVTQPDRDPAAELAGYPRPVVDHFEFLLKAAQEATVLQEDHNFWIDQRSMFEIRRVLLEFGDRLARAGGLAAPQDVFFLNLEELRDAAHLPATGLREIVAARRAEMDGFRVVTPPLALGTPPGSASDTPVARAIAKFFGLPLEPSADPSVLRGNPGSAGTFRGPARIIRSLDDAGRLRKGDVLVAQATLPPWTALFATVGAVVTDSGGSPATPLS